MHSMVRAPVLSATRRRLDGWITRASSSASSAAAPRRPAVRRGIASRPGWAAMWMASLGLGLLGHDDVALAGARRPRATISTRRQRLVADSGRDSSMRTVSPMRASLRSSWALNLVVRRMTRLYSRWRESARPRRRSSCPSCRRRRGRPWPCACPGAAPARALIDFTSGGRAPTAAAAVPICALGLDGQQAGDVAPRLRDLAVVGQLAGGQLEPQVVEVTARGRELGAELLVGQLAGLSDVHRRPLRAPGT